MVNDKIKQAVILAAGRGSRMKSNIPKPLLGLNGELIIERKLKYLKKHNVQVCVVINPQFEEVFREKLKKYDITYCYQTKPLGTGNALYAAKDFVKDDMFLLMMGDDIAEFNMEDALKSKEPVVFGYEVEDMSKYGALLIEKDGTVSDILEKKLTGKGMANSGVYVMPRALFTYYDELKAGTIGTEEYVTDAVRVLSKHGIKFRLGRLDRWYGINTKADLFKAKIYSIRDTTLKTIGLGR